MSKKINSGKELKGGAPAANAEETKAGLETLSTTELHDLAWSKWLEYFKKDAKYTKAEKTKLMNEYNEIAKLVNEKQPITTMQLLTPSTVWVPKSSEDMLTNEETKPTVIDRTAQSSSADNTPSNAPNSVEQPAAKLTIQTEPKVKAEKKEGKGLIDQILDLHKAGKSNKEIIAAGYNKSTVARQVSEYKKKNQPENGTAQSSQAASEAGGPTS